jgi:hypothetical protein
VQFTGLTRVGHFNDGALAFAIRPEHAQDFSRADGAAKVWLCGHGAIAPGKVASFEDGRSIYG